MPTCKPYEVGFLADVGNDKLLGRSSKKLVRFPLLLPA
jgi:hypothetical protein